MVAHPGPVQMTTSAGVLDPVSGILLSPMLAAAAMAARGCEEEVSDTKPVRNPSVCSYR
jgi:hypothetical protein